MRSLRIARQPGTTTDERRIPWLSAAPASSVLPTGLRFYRWTLGFKQSSLNLIAQALRSDSIHAFRRPPLHQHALVPITFRLQVSWFASESVPELHPIYSGIHSVRTTAHPLDAVRLYG